MSPLDEVPSGKRTLIRKLHGGREFVNRMAALGFTLGAEVKVVQNYRRGPLIALVRGSRVALGRGEAAKVLVEVITNDLGANTISTR